MPKWTIGYGCRKPGISAAPGLSGWVQEKTFLVSRRARPAAAPSFTHELRMQRAWHLPLISAALLSAAVCADAQTSRESESLVDSLEYKVEIDRQTRFVMKRRSSPGQLAAFASDGCSGGLSVGWAYATTTISALAKRIGERPPWESCCTEHDRIYHTGGPPHGDAETSFAARRDADEHLRACVRRVGEDRSQSLAIDYGIGRDEVDLIYRGISDVMYRAVRLGGAPCTGLSWRWGFGWPDC